MASELFDEHAAILNAVEDIARAAGRKPRMRLDELSRMRVRLSHLIKQHRQAEDQHILTPYRQPEAFEALPHVKPVMDEIRMAWLHYTDHVRIWTPRAIEADWDGYATAVHRGLDGLRVMMAREEEAIYQAVLHHVLTRQAIARTRTYSIGLPSN